MIHRIYFVEEKGKKERKMLIKFENIKKGQNLC